MTILLLGVENAYLLLYGEDILFGILNGTIEILPKCLSYTLKDLILWKAEVFLYLRAHKHFWNAPSLVNAR